MEARGAPPEATSAANADTIMMIGMHTPTPVSARLPTSGNVADVDAVHDVIEHVDELGDDRRHGQPHEQFADRFRAQKRLIFGLHIRQILSD